DHWRARSGGEVRRGRVDLGAVRVQKVHEVGRLRRSRLRCGNHESVRRLTLAYRYGILGLRYEVAEKGLWVVRNVTECHENAGLLVVDVAADAPPHAVHRGVRTEPLARCVVLSQLHGMAIGASRGVRLV